ncbi:MAG: hypothetical protein AAFY65_10440 [Pseudomonadota bacterium]
MHRDLGAGRVAWMSWWAQEGVFTDLNVAECRAHRVLTSRLREENIKDRAFDRRDRGREVFDRHMRRAPAFFRLDDLAEDLALVGEDTRIEAITSETCGCAALYPDARGHLPAFVLRPVTTVTGDNL